MELIKCDPSTPYARYQTACRYYIAILTFMIGHLQIEI
jgi:hypothetical protein